MKTLQELAVELNVTINNEGFVTDLGKFENEYIATVYYWSESLNGIGETFPLGDDSSETLIEVSDYEKQMFDLPTWAAYYYIRERSDGFVLGKEITKAQYEQFLKTVEEEEAV